MPLLIRQDGVPFVVYTYREIVPAHKPSLLKRELSLLAKEHGQYARFFLLPDGNIEAVFSRDEGYLLGETIWQNFGNPNDFIYCEALGKTENVLLVIVRNGSVHLDAEISRANLMDELIALIGGNNTYEIYVYGDLPLAETPSEDKFAFDSHMVKSFSVLNEPVFPRVSTDESLKLIQIEDALAELPQAPQGVLKLLIILLLIGGISYGAWHVFHKSSQPVSGQINSVVHNVSTPADPYQGYKSALATPAPSDLVEQFVSYIKLLITIPGWTPVSMTWTEDQLQFAVKSVGGNTGLLLAWVKNTQANLQLAQGNASINFTLQVPNRSAPAQLYNLRDTVAQLYDSLRIIFPDVQPTLSDVTANGAYSQIDMSFAFNEVSLSVLILLSNQLQAFPVVLKSCNFTTINEGIVSGNITLTILGATQ